MVDVRWKRTWPDAKRDFSAHDADNDGYVGRIQIGHNSARWAWSCVGANGSCESKEDAAAAVRAQWQHACRLRPEIRAALWPRVGQDQAD